MLSRLIITFLCAAAIGSVSGAFLTFNPEQIDMKDIEVFIRFSAKLNSRPTEAVTVYFEHPSMFMSDCRILFNADNWNVPQEIMGAPALLLLGLSSSPPPLEFNSELLARAETVGPLPAELSTIDTLKITQRGSVRLRSCSITENQVNTFDGLKSSFNKPGWYYMMFTKDIEIQVFMDECTAGLLCVKKVLVRYGPTVMRMDVSGPVKSLREYSPTYVTQNISGLRYSLRRNSHNHRFFFPYGSRLDVDLVKNGDIISLDVGMSLATGYSSSDGLCNIPRDPSQNNKLLGSDSKSYNPTNDNDAAIFVDSWKIRDEDVLTNPGARTLNLPIRPGTVCKFPEKPPPKPTTTTAVTTTTTAAAAAAAAVDLSESTLFPTITYTLSSTTITTSPSTTSTTLPYLPDPLPTPGRHARSSSPPSPQPDVVDEIQRCLKPARI
ncbi:hypothetical protein BASA83_006794 [Batrachochytrium salamandrivorans]|nr:hypothetical protein BASA81_011866 [Batrachochytrium salamandrivorans]KAH9271041.1 hypothetical protein BASA83_006794 [Batrachochytrium salamandrivorans]